MYRMELRMPSKVTEAYRHALAYLVALCAILMRGLVLILLVLLLRIFYSFYLHNCITPTI